MLLIHTVEGNREEWIGTSALGVQRWQFSCARSEGGRYQSGDLFQCGPALVKRTT